MEDRIIAKIEEQVKCSICLDIYTNPKLLWCIHAFCQHCLVKLVDRDEHGQLSINCPSCRQVTPVENREVSNLQPAFHMNSLLEIRECMQNPEDPTAIPELETATLAGAEPTSDKEPGPTTVGDSARKTSCFIHEKELKLYCESCEKLICTRCALFGVHKGHNFSEVNKAFEKYREEITSSLEPLGEQVVTLKEALVQFDLRSKEISDQQTITTYDIHITFEQIQKMLDTRKAKLINQLDKMTHDKLKHLAVERDQVEIKLAEVKSCRHFLKQSLLGENEAVALMMKTNSIYRAKELAVPFEGSLLEPQIKADTRFTASTDMTELSQSYGHVYKFTPSLPDQSRCHAKGMGIKVAAVGEKSTATLQVLDFQAKPCQVPVRSLECKIVSEITGTSVSCCVERGRHGQYTISYQPTIHGRHQLHIRVEGQHIKGSPFWISAKLPSFSVRTKVMTITNVGAPYAMEITKRGELVVTEKNLHCVSVYSLSGEKLRSFGSIGANEGQFHGPRGVTVDGEGNILVSDSHNGRIQKFTVDGEFLKAVGTEGNGALEFSSPSGISFNAKSGKVYVTDWGNDRIQVLNSDLTFSSTFGRRGKDIGEFDSPAGVACDSTGKVYVVDSFNHRVQVFTAEGEFLSTFGSYGTGLGKLAYPNGAVTDSNGMVYVTEGGNHRVSVFTLDGQFVNSFGEEPADIRVPGGVEVDSSGVVYVCDWDMHNIHCF